MITVDLLSALRGFSPHTQRAYQRWIRTYTGLSDLEALCPTEAGKRLTASQAKSWIAGLKARGLAHQSLGQAKGAIVWLAQFLADAGHVPAEVPAMLSHIKIPRAAAGQRVGSWLSVSEIRALITAAGTGETGIRNTAIIQMMVVCGMRRAEVASARWGDILKQGDFQVLRVHGKGNKIRLVKLPDMVLESLAQWQEISPEPVSSGGAIFVSLRSCTPLSTKTIWNLVRAISIKAGLACISPHDLRRSFARGAYEAGTPLELIRQALGHANIATTEHYINAQLVVDRAATDIFAEVLDTSAKVPRLRRALKARGLKP